MTKEIMEKLGNSAGNIIALLAEAEGKDIVHLTSNDNTQSIVYVRGEDHVKELAKCVGVYGAKENRKPMTPTQTQQAIRIMSKHGQEGWKIEHRSYGKYLDWEDSVPDWNWVDNLYRAVGPRKRVELKRGMEVKYADGAVIVVMLDELHGFIHAANTSDSWLMNVGHLTHYRWPNLETDWLPIEGEPEIISMEGVE